MRRKLTLLAALTLLTAIAITGCKDKYEDLDLTGIHTSAEETTPEAETMAETTAAEQEEAETEPETSDSDTAGSDSVTALSVRSSIATEKDGKVSIEYPILSNLRDQKTEDLVNDRIREYATMLVDVYELDPAKDNVTIQCDIISLDRSKATLKFTGSMMADGAAHPSALFYTMNVDLADGSLQTLNDYADPYTMAGYIISEDCIITSSEDDAAVKEYLSTLDLNTLWETLKNCDFSAEKADAFPSAFSYVNQGIIYISVPVPHALGDYAIVEFHPEGK